MIEAYVSNGEQPASNHKFIESATPGQFLESLNDDRPIRQTITGYCEVINDKASAVVCLSGCRPSSSTSTSSEVLLKGG